MVFVPIFRYIKKDTMRTMKTLRVYEHLINQGQAYVATDLLMLFEEVEDIDYDGLLGFLTIYYGEFAQEIFLNMQCHVTTTLTFD